MIEHFWKDKYPAGITAEINPDEFPNIQAVLKQSCQRFADKPLQAIQRHTADVSQRLQDGHRSCGRDHVRAAAFPEAKAAVRILQRGQPLADCLTGLRLLGKRPGSEPPGRAAHLGTAPGHVHDPGLVGHLAAFDPAQRRSTLAAVEAAAEDPGGAGQNIRRRAQEDIAKAHMFAIEGFAESLLAVKDSSAECGDDSAVETSGQGNPDAFIRREEPGIHSIGKCTSNIVVTNGQFCAGRWLVAPRPCRFRMYVKRWNHPTGDEIRLQRL